MEKTSLKTFMQNKPAFMRRIAVSLVMILFILTTGISGVNAAKAKVQPPGTANV